jgi:putative tricarboxylic transport membrane protein
MPPLGFIIASALMFMLVARAFGSRRIVVDAALGLAFAGTIDVVFVHGLGLYLPPGSVWENPPWTP